MHNPGHHQRITIATLVLIVLLGLFVRAGIWQLDRANEKLALQAEFDAGSAVAPLRSLVDSAAAMEFRYRRFELQGHYEPARQILLDNMVAGGLNGYQVLTPFRTGDATVLINRGWLRGSGDRSVLPEITVAAGGRTIVARLDKFPAPGVRLSPSTDISGEWPRRMLYPERQMLADALGMEIPDYQLLLEPGQPDGYLRDWQAVGTGPQKNYGYAFQWFAFALLGLILYIIVNLRWYRQRRQPPVKNQ